MIQLFDVEGSGIRFGTTEDGTPYSVASDFAKALGHRDASNAIRILDPDEKGTQIVSTPGGDQRLSVIYEDGMWELIFRSTLPGAKAIKKRVKEILRQIRETGSYTPAYPDVRDSSDLELMNLLEAHSQLVNRTRKLLTEKATVVAQNRALTAKNGELNDTIRENQPKVESFEQLMGSEGTLSFAQAAKVLGIPGIGRNKLFELLRENGLLIGRSREPYQEYIDRGYFEVVSTTRPGEGEVRIPTYVPRITPKGLEYIRRIVLGA